MGYYFPCRQTDKNKLVQYSFFLHFRFKSVFNLEFQPKLVFNLEFLFQWGRIWESVYYPNILHSQKKQLTTWYHHFSQLSVHIQLGGLIKLREDYRKYYLYS